MLCPCYSLPFACTTLASFANGSNPNSLLSTSEVTLIHSTFESNCARDAVFSKTGFGGALYLINSTAVVENCSFRFNLAESGGVIAAQDSSIVSFKTSNISANTAVNGGVAQVSFSRWVGIDEPCNKTVDTGIRLYRSLIQAE